MPVYVRTDVPWRDPAFRSPLFEQTISLPFAGIGGPDRALIEGQWPHRTANVIEKRAECIGVLDRLHGSGTARCEDIMNIKLQQWADSEGLMCGPPCVDFSMQGNGEGLYGAHGSLFGHTLGMIKGLSHRRRKLRWIVLENVVAIGYNRAGGNALHEIMQWWSENMPHWTELAVWILDAQDFGLAQRRRRCFLVAFESDFASVVGGLPAEPAKMEKVSLSDFLLDHAPNGRFFNHGLSELQRTNLAEYEQVFGESDCADSELAVVDISRSPKSRSFNNRVHAGYCPTLTTQNRYLQVMSKNQSPNAKVPLLGCSRPLILEERALLSGVTWESVMGMQSPNQLVQSFGNIIPVNLAGVVLQVIFDKWAKFEDAGMRVPRPLRVFAGSNAKARPRKKLRCAAAQADDSD